MYLLSTFLFCIIGLKIGVFAELSPSSCSFLRTATSIATVLPEIAQMAMRHYSASLSSASHHRQKRFLFGDNMSKDSTYTGTKASVLEQMVVTAFSDVNVTAVASLILNNNETMAKIRQNIDGDAIIRAAMRDIDYEKLGSSLLYGAEAEFNLEYLISSLINLTNINLIHEELMKNGTLPDWLIKSIHPDLNVQNVQRMFEEMKDFTLKFVKIMNSSERFDDYLFNITQQNVLIPLEKIMQKVKEDKPTTLDQLLEIILTDINKIIMEKTTTKPTITKPPSKTETATIAISESHYDDVKLLLYQCSIAMDSIGQTARVVFKALEQLYCTSIWD